MTHSMKLYFNGASPFVRKVTALAHEVGVADSIELVAVGGTPTNSDSLLDSGNPLGKIPALKLDSGSDLYDSRTICRYLNDLARGQMYPEPPALWEALTLEATADGIMDAAVLMVYETRCRDEASRSGEWVESQWQKIARSLDAIDSGWVNYLAGSVGIGQISVGCALGYIDLRHPERNWRLGREGLSNWYEEFSVRKCMVETVPFIPA